MKKTLLALIIATASTSCAFAQRTTEKMVIRQTNGNETKFIVSSVDKIYFVEDEPQYVDLGLPSGTKWAACNLGADAPEDYGNYYGWGCTTPYAEDDDITWQLYFQKLGGEGTSAGDCGTAKDPLQDYVEPNSKSISGTEWDAAKKALGGLWRMPTEDEIHELISNCNWTWTTENGVNGYKAVSKSDATKYIFLPAAGDRYGTTLDQADVYGFYWTAAPHVNSPNAIYFSIFSAYRRVANRPRNYGYTIRPVYAAPQPE